MWFTDKEKPDYGLTIEDKYHIKKLVKAELELLAVYSSPDPPKGATPRSRELYKVDHERYIAFTKLSRIIDNL